MVKKKFYEKTWFMWLMLFLFAPVGIFLLWRYHSNMKSITKILITIVFSLLFVSALFGGSDGEKEHKETNNSKVEEVTMVTVPDFSNLSKDEVTSWCNENKIICEYENEYSNSIAVGDFISQSINSEKQIREGEKIKIAYSLGVEPSKEFKNALKKAQNYSDSMHMSKVSIYEQLVSEYGENFETDAAQYAVDNMVADWNYNALKKAESYAESMHMSKASIYDQLISEYGEQFTEEQAQYAIDNIVADWNANALIKAKSYQNDMNMSINAIYDQLVSEYGEQFTAEEAQYAIDNLE